MLWALQINISQFIFLTLCVLACVAISLSSLFFGSCFSCVRSVVLCSRRQDIFSKCRVRSWLCARELVPALDFRSCFALGLDLRTRGFRGASPFRFTVSVRERAVNEAAPCVSLVWLRVCFVWLCFRGAAPPLPPQLPPLSPPSFSVPVCAHGGLGVRCGEGRCHVRPRHRPRLKPAG